MNKKHHANGCFGNPNKNTVATTVKTRSNDEGSAS